MDENADAYRDAVMAAVLCAELLTLHDFDKLLGDIERADAVGPLFHPTEWVKKHKQMYEDREVFQAARHLAALGRKMAKLREEKAAAAG